VKGAAAAIEALRQEGVSHIFGLPGTTIMQLIDALAQQSEIRYISVRHEQVAAFMADGFARASGSVGVCLASRGPGAANMAIAVHNAHAESIPVLALVGQVADEIAQKDAFEEMDLLRFFEPITKWSTEIHVPARVPELIQRAVRTAVSGRPGPVMASLPLDVQLAEADMSFERRFRPSAPMPSPAQAQAAAQLLAAAQRPVVVAGGGMLRAEFDAGLLELAERLQLPVVTTWLRKNAFPNDSVLCFGSLGYGATRVTEDLVRDADVLLSLGCRFSEFTTKRWTLVSSATKIVQVDVDAAELGRHYVPEIALQADAGGAVTALLDAIERPSPAQFSSIDARREWCASLRGRYLEELRLEDAGDGDDSAPVTSAALVVGLKDALVRHSSILVQDAPSLGPWIQRHIDFTRPGTYYAAAGGSMGWGLPAAMGIQLARPDARVLAVCGDGSFWMVAQDLETAVREDIPVVVVINNNYAFGNTRDRQRVAHDERYLGVFYGNPDFAAFARLLGAHGERVEKASELKSALDRAMASGKPAVVDVIQDIYEGLPADLVPPAAR